MLLPSMSRQSGERFFRLCVILVTWPTVAKYRVVEGAGRVVDQTMDVAGGFGIWRQACIERLFRDAHVGRIYLGMRR
jgi:alkylation response protein AidB-like acyl-CoA dehydrogenase